MAVCKKCGKETEDVYSYVIIRTMTVRDIKGDKHYEAMGDVVDAAFCAACIDEYIANSKSVKDKLRRLAKLPLLLVAVAIAAPFLGLGAKGWVISIVFAAFGIAVFAAELKKALAAAKAATAAADYTNRKNAIGALAAQTLPKKHNDADLKYIPVTRLMNESTEALSKDFRVSRKKLGSIKSYMINGKKPEEKPD